jgi:hypothetical protein
MTRVCCVAFALPVVAMLVSPGSTRAATPALLAANRCNSQTIDDVSGRVRDYDRHAAGGGSTQLLQRYGAIADVLSMLNEEREILDSICSSDAQRAPLFAQIAAFSAWALALESDVAVKLNVSCGTAFAEVIPKIQTRAAVVGLALPPWPDASAYWRDQVRARSKSAVAACPSPSPSPSPPSSPS